MINKQAAQHRITDYIKTPEDAIETITYLASLDWYSIYAAKEQGEREYEQEEKRREQEILASGGGYCSGCNKLVRRLVVFAHTHNMRGDAIGSSSPKGNYCLSCIGRHERNFLINPQEFHDSCEACNAILTKRLLYKHPAIPHNYSGYCRTCFDELTERQTIICSICGAKVVEHVSKEVCNACYKKYPYQSVVSSHLTRAKVVGAPASLTLVQWKTAVEYFNYRCAYCGDRPYTVLEHYRPISLLGGTCADNCVPSCEKCNGRKGNRHPDTLDSLFPAENLARIREYLESQRQVA